MRPPVLPLRIFFVPHRKYRGAAKRFQLHVPTVFAGVMFTPLPSPTVFIDNDRSCSAVACAVAKLDLRLVPDRRNRRNSSTTNSVEHDENKAAHEFRRRLKVPRNKKLP